MVGQLSRSAVAVVAAFAASASRAAAADEHDVPFGFTLSAAAEATVEYDDNALLGRRGQFLDSPTGDEIGGSREADVASSQSVELDLKRRVRRRDRVEVAARFDLRWLREVEELRGYDARVAASYEASVGDRTAVSPSLQFAYHREDVEWSFLTVEPALRVAHTFGVGVASELRYRFSDQRFARRADGSTEPKNSYENIDVQSHFAELDLRMWHGRSVRSNLTADFRTASFGGNLAPNLADFAALESGTQRRDIGGGFTAGALVLLWHGVGVGPGVRFELNRSNAAPFTFRAGHVLADALWQFADSHALYGQVDFARFDFPDEHFDRRFTNTRRDVRRDFLATYRYQPNPQFRAELIYRRLDSVSNDCAEFDPARDEFGLPVYSRSYSCYTQNRIEASLRYEF